MAGRRPADRHRGRPRREPRRDLRAANDGVRRRHGASADRTAGLPDRRPAGAADIRHARSFEFDAILLAAAPDALSARDDKAGALGSRRVDPRVLLLVDECWRQVKAIRTWGSGTAVLEAAGVAGAPSVVATDSGRDTLSAMQSLLAAQLVWERFPASVA
jgi:hypothetical protein